MNKNSDKKYKFFYFISGDSDSYCDCRHSQNELSTSLKCCKDLMRKAKKLGCVNHWTGYIYAVDEPCEKIVNQWNQCAPSRKEVLKRLDELETYKSDSDDFEKEEENEFEKVEEVDEK